MNTRAPILTALAVTVGLLTACGGSSTSTEDAEGDVVETTSPDTTPATTDPPPTSSAPTTIARDPSLPEWASGAMVTVDSDTGPLEMPVELAPFCESSRSFYLAAKGLDHVGEGQFGAAEQLFGALMALSPVTIETAPSEDFATQPTAASEQLALLVPAFVQIGFDTTAVQSLSDPQSFSDTLLEFVETRTALQEFLVQACGADDAILEEQARATAAAAGGEAVDPAGPVEAAAGEPITNEPSTIAVSVPMAWADVEDGIESGRDVLVASSDLDGFYDLTTPGVLVLRGEGGFRDGGFVGRVLEFQAGLEAVGCVLAGERGYDDGTYSGQERILDCGTAGLDVRLLGGVTADESLYAVVLLVNPIDEPGIRQLIVDSFLVS